MGRKRKLVFCGDCRHYVSGYSDREYEHCLRAMQVKEQDHAHRWTRNETPAEKNAKNDCQDWDNRWK